MIHIVDHVYTISISYVVYFYDNLEWAVTIYVFFFNFNARFSY